MKEMGIMEEAIVSNIQETKATSSVRTHTAPLALILILALAGLSRMIEISADPPQWMQGAFISDEGWWADCARGKIFFNNYYSDDFGTAYLVTPGYTWALEGIYKLWGVGTAQTRMLEALACLLTIGIIAGVFWKRVGHFEGLIAALMLTLSPFYWSYGRIGLIEPLQEMFIAASFALWVLSDRSSWLALASGAALAAAIVVKPNAVVLGGFPLALAVAGGFAVECAARARGGRRVLCRDHALRILMAGAGLGLVLGAVYVGHVRPNWHAFKIMATAESGSLEDTWRQRIQLPGMLLLSTEMRGNTNVPVWWNPAHYSPALVACCWLAMLSLMVRVRGGLKGLLQALDPFEAQALCWMLGTFVVLGSAYYQPDRRYVLLIPCLAVVSALFLGRSLRTAAALPQDNLPGRGNWLYSYVLWAVLTLPVLVLLKPLVSYLFMVLGHGLHIGRDAGLSYAVAGTFFMMLWLPMLALLAFNRRYADRLCRFFLQRTMIVFLPAFLLLLEGTMIARQFVIQGHTMERQQAALGHILKEGETVLGHVSTTILMPVKVRTVRRVSQFENTPPPNPDIWDRLKPRYILEMTERNYDPASPLYDDLVKKGNYRLIYTFEMGPYLYGTPRYQFKLYDRAPGGGAAPMVAGKNK